MSIPLSRYSYLPLKSNSVRILELFSLKDASLALHMPTSQSLPLYGQLTHLQLDESPFYSALSYVWGDPKATDKILLRKGDLHIEELGIAANLTKALKAIRAQDCSRFLWIDAICINQNDLAERSKEVQHMHHIYSKAANVRTWIDVDFKPGDEAIRRLPILSPNHVTRFDKAETGMSPIVHVNPDEESDDDGVGDRAEVWRSLSNLCSNSYWERVWIQQEIRNAADIIIHCGSTTIAGEDFAEFLRQIDKRLHTAPEKQAFTDQREWYDFLTPIQAMMANRSLFYRKKRRSNPKTADTTHGALKRDIFATLQFAKRWLKATDSRDYVYGILSLIDDFVEGKFSIQVDYKLSVVEVYTQAVDTIIRSYHTLHFLTAADLGTTQKDRGLPSWVPDWSLETHHLSLSATEPLRLVDTSDKQQPASYFPSISPCGRILTVTGVQVGKVLHLYKDVKVHSKWEPETPVKEIASMFHQLEDISHTAFELQNASGYEPRPLAWSEYADEPDAQRLSTLRAITAFECMGEAHYVLENFYEVIKGMADVTEVFLDDNDAIEPMPTTRNGVVIVSGSDWSTKRTLKSLLSVTGSNKGEDATLSTVLDWIAAAPGSKNMLSNRVHTVNWRRQLFISQEGLIGVVPEDAAIGDEIWFIPGCGVPVLLHPEKGNFVVVGEAHINDYPFSDAGSNIEEAHASARSSEDTRFQHISLI